MLIKNSSAPGFGNGPPLPELHRRLKWVALGCIATLILLVGRLWQRPVEPFQAVHEVKHASRC